MDVENITEENFTQKYYQKYCTFGDVFNNLENQYEKNRKIKSRQNTQGKNRNF